MLDPVIKDDWKLIFNDLDYLGLNPGIDLPDRANVRFNFVVVDIVQQVDYAKVILIQVGLDILVFRAKISTGHWACRVIAPIDCHR